MRIGGEVVLTEQLLCQSVVLEMGLVEEYQLGGLPS